MDEADGCSEDTMHTTSRRQFFGQLGRSAFGGSLAVFGWQALVEAAEAAGKDPRQLLEEGAIIFEENFENGISAYGPTKVECVVDASESHSGDRCLKSFVNQKQQGNDIGFPVRLDGDSLYYMEVWLRSDNRCGVSAGIMKDWANRQAITRFQHIPKRWTKFEVIFRQMAPGQDKISFYMPNTWFGNTGTVWLDDIRIRRIATCKAKPVTAGEGYVEGCALAAAGENSAQLVWLAHVRGEEKPLTAQQQALAKQGALGLAYAEGTDRILTRSYASAGWGPSQQLAEGALFHPGVAANEKGESCVVWTQRGDDANWSIRYRFLNEQGWGKTIRASVAAAAAWHPAVAADADGRFQCAWCAADGGTCRIYVAGLGADAVANAVALSPTDRNAYRPDVAVEADGTLWVAWQEFDGESYQIVARKATLTQGVPKWSDPIVIAGSDLDEAHVKMTPDPEPGGGMWFAYDVGTIPKGRRKFMHWSVLQRTDMRMELVRYRRGKLTALYPDYGQWPLNSAGELGRVAFDRRGHLWLVERAYNRPDSRHWDLSVRRYSGAGDGWEKPKILSGARQGWGFSPAVATLRDGVLVVWQFDTRPVSSTERNTGSSDLLAELVPAARGIPARPKESPPRERKREEKKAFKDTGPRYSIEYNGKKLYVFWGELHIHSRLSMCAGNRDLLPFDSYAYNRDYQDLDFMALTDHSGHINYAEWFNTRKLASLQNDPPHFVAFSAHEWSSARVGYDGTGHKNIFYLNDGCVRWYNPRLAMRPDVLWRELGECGDEVFTVPHQLADAGGGPAYTDWSYRNDRMQPVAEVFQIRGSYEYLGCPSMSPSAMKKKGAFYQDALDLGHHLGAIASSDHGGGNGKAAVFAEKLDREHIFRAVQARRCYGSTDARVLLDFRLNGHLMGEIIDGQGKPREITARVMARRPLAEVVVFKNGQVIVEKTAPLGESLAFEHEDGKQERPEDYYYLRAIQDDGEICWSSPVWVRG